MDDYQTIIFEIGEDVAVLRLNRPETMNALNAQMRAEITDAVRRGAEAARVVALTGSGGAFCSGQDLGDVSEPERLDMERILLDEYAPMIGAIAQCPVPTICAVNGTAAGAGANLALAADVVIAAHSASFVQAFARIGLIPDAGGTHWLPRTIGAAKAMGAALFAEPVSARDAEAWGMIWEAVADDEFEARWRSRARQLAQGPGVALGNIKRSIRESWDNGFDEQFRLEARLQQRCGATEDFREGVAAFREKRPAKFQGR